MTEPKALADLKVGDVVSRRVGGQVLMDLKVTAIEDGLIVCHPWAFDQKTGGEVDDELGWDGTSVTGSIIEAKGKE